MIASAASWVLCNVLVFNKQSPTNQIDHSIPEIQYNGIVPAIDIAQIYSISKGVCNSELLKC